MAKKIITVEEKYRNGHVKQKLDRPFRANVLKVARQWGGKKVQAGDPQYVCCDVTMTDEMVELGLHMQLRVHYTAQELSEAWGESKGKTKALLDEMAMIGLIVSDPGCDPIEYHVPIYAPGIYEHILAHDGMAEKYPEVARSFGEFTINAIIDMLGMPVGRGGMRTIPIERALDSGSHAEPFEKISHYIEQYDDLCITPCTCRRSRRMMGEGCEHIEDDMCMLIGHGARYFLDNERGRKIDKEEAYEILKRAEDNGLMHTIPNTEGDGETFAICNCCGCSCYALRSGRYFDNLQVMKSNFVASVDTEECVACGRCVENCPTNAVKLGKKLNDKTPIELPTKPNINTTDWTPDLWNPDYRLNRQNCINEMGTAPCKTACPANVAVQGYLKHAHEGRYREALELIKKNNPFPAICGSICNRKCEDVCTRATLDEAIAIDEVKKFVAEQDLKSEERFIPKKWRDYHDIKIAIVGAGPSGLACAYYLALDNYDVTVYDKNPEAGGMLKYGIPGFRLDREVIEAEIDVLKTLGIKFQFNTEIGKDKTISDLREEGYKGFYIAVGAQGGRFLGLEGEEAEGIQTGIDFLRKVNIGEDAGIKGKTVVIGGGNVAVDVARAALRKGASTVELFCLESEEEMPADVEEIYETREEGIGINNNWGPARIVSKDGKVTGIEFKKCTSVFDSEGRFNPKFDESETKMVECDSVLLSVGQVIDWGQLFEGENVEISPRNTAIVDKITLQSSQPDIFIGGDAVTGPLFAINAIASGKEAAISLHRYVHPGHDLVYGRDRHNYVSIDLDNTAIPISNYDNTPRHKVSHKEVVDKFKDNRSTFTEDMVVAESGRCLSCGATYVDETLCVGCGQCVMQCKFDAIKLKKVHNQPQIALEEFKADVIGHVLKRKMIITRNKVVAKAFKKKK